MLARLRVVIVALTMVLGGCASLDVYRAAPMAAHLAGGIASDEARCARLFHEVDKAVDAAGVRDARGTRLPGFPYLRSDRLLAALAPRDGAHELFNDWVHRLAAMDEDSRRNELNHLPTPLPGIDGGIDGGYSRESMLASLQRCRLQLAGADFAQDSTGILAREAARVPAEYQSWKRVLGLYPLTRIPFASGVRAWQADTEALFNTPMVALPRKGRAVRYAPPYGRLDLAGLASLFAGAKRDPLGLFDWSAAERDWLFSWYAPRFQVDEATHDDRIGALEFDADANLWVNTFRPVVYRRLSHVKLGGHWLPQFVYSIWFPARTAESAIDILAGRFDALIWRVTVGLDGHPLVYDTIHACGCYHLFIPTAAVRARPQPDSLDETLFAPQILPRMSAGDPLLLRIAAGTHYLQRVTPDSAATEDVQVYEFADDDVLRSLPLPYPAPGGVVRRSVFGPDGILPGSERAERFLFWPMGVDNAGAMRQWGRHATAFVGQRHFDDADLFERYFEIR